MTSQVGSPSFTALKSKNSFIDDSKNDKFSNDHDSDMDDDDDDQEAKHFERILATFLHYKKRSLRFLKRQLAYYKNHVTSAQKKSLNLRYVEHLSRVKLCVEENQKFLNEIVRNVLTGMFENSAGKIGREENSNKNFGAKISTLDRLANDERLVSAFNMVKLKSTLKQFVRDWSEEGKEERQSCYEPILNDLKQLFPNPRGINVLVPGAGLGRLAWEIARLGYNCEGNEFSLFMLFGSNFILNHCPQANHVTFYPWIHQWTNNRSYEDQIRPIKVPDVDTSQPIPIDVRFSMSAGEFTRIYRKNSASDAGDATTNQNRSRDQNKIIVDQSKSTTLNKRSNGDEKEESKMTSRMEVLGDLPELKNCVESNQSDLSESSQVDSCSNGLEGGPCSIDQSDSTSIKQQAPPTFIDADQYDCIATVFFIDTARNILDYLDVIARRLKPGGYWLNVGPLLYHHVDDQDDDDWSANFDKGEGGASVEGGTVPLPYQELKRIITTTPEYGFEMVHEVLDLKSTYAQNVRSMLKYNYECVKFVCRKI